LTLGSLLVTGYLICAFYVCDARGFEALITRMKKLATGDLTTNYPAQGSDEIGVLINSFNDSRASLQQMVHRIHHAADTISTAGHEIAAANMDLSQRGSTQSAVIGETFERVKEISEKIQTNLDGTGNANHIAEDAFTATQRGKTVVDSVVHTMDAMTGSSKRIGAIIGVINEIAFQTNLLALNAAVEAARAGEQGRGFAVVAGEVRNLAQRCATAANEITALIKNSVDEVNKGVSQVATAGKSMDEILAGVHSVSEIMGNMTRAGKTQADGIKVIESAVQKIDDDAQQNAALVEQTASAAELLRQQVAVLMESVGHFTLGGEQAVGFESPPVHTQSAAPDEISQAA
jgi:methyl-accepting chemotaxis protein